ncbi:MAG: aldo/keto reductase, partial [Mariniphaga sp.]|nr:aldo/keto reductase [Mariniphaga sp.]
LRNFSPMEGQEFDQFAALINPFFKGEKLPWMKHGYCDGHWV